MSAEIDLQRAIFETLRNDPVLISLLAPHAFDGGPAIYDAVPQAADSQVIAAFPFITIGDDTMAADDTDTSLGSDFTISLHVWARSPKGRSQVKAIQGALYERLHRTEQLDFAVPMGGSPPEPGPPPWHIQDVLFESSQTFLDPDGETRHGVSLFRVVIQPGE